MARKSNKTSKNAVVIADSIENVVIDHHSQMSSWEPSFAQTVEFGAETVELSTTNLETTIEPPVTDAEIVEVIHEFLDEQNAVLDAEAPAVLAPDLYAEFGPVIEMSPELETLLEQIEGEEVRVTSATEEVQETPASNEPQGPTFAEIIAAYDEETVLAKAHAIADSITDRAAYERSTNPENANIQRTLAKVQSAFVSKAAARVMLATATSPDFINRSVHEGKRYNVYALGKAADIMKAATDGVLSNAINNACMRSLFAMRGAGLPFTLETAKACASKNYQCDAAVRRHLTRHTVSPSTAPTQASSTMQALVTLGVVKSTGSSKNPTFVLTDNPIVAHLEEVLKAA